VNPTVAYTDLAAVAAAAIALSGVGRPRLLRNLHAAVGTNSKTSSIGQSMVAKNSSFM
jgi:hypothetical protein